MGMQSYCFSMKGVTHEERQLPCQDYSAVLIRNELWRLAVVADGVGSCKHSDIASRVAVETACSVVQAAFPYDGDENFLALIRIAMHSAENAIENYVAKNNAKLQDYQTTLALALYNGKTVYYGNAGDSGIVALDEYGSYHVLTKKQNNEFGEVYTLQVRDFEVGKAQFNAVAVICMTDGLLDWVVPRSLEKHKYNIHVPRANLFVPPEIWSDKVQFDHEKTSEYKKLLQDTLMKFAGKVDTDSDDEFLGSLREGNLKDDLSVSVLIDADNPYLKPEDIQWEAPAELSVEEQYLKEWRRLKNSYPSVAEQLFFKSILNENPEWSQTKVDEYAQLIWTMDTTEESVKKSEIFSEQKVSQELKSDTSNQEHWRKKKGEDCLQSEKLIPHEESCSESRREKSKRKKHEERGKRCGEEIGAKVGSFLGKLMDSFSDESEKNLDKKEDKIVEAKTAISLENSSNETTDSNCEGSRNED